MSATVTTIEPVPLAEDDPEARASYRMTVSAGGRVFGLHFTVLQTAPCEMLPEGLTYLHSHSEDLMRELVPRHFDYGGPNPLHRVIFAAHRGDVPTLPALISDRGAIEEPASARLPLSRAHGGASPEL